MRAAVFVVAAAVSAGLAVAEDPPFEALPVSGVATWYVDGAEPEEAPEWSRNGSSLDFAKLRGKVVVLEFWLAWCPGCGRVRPALNALHTKHPEDLLLLGVTIPDEKKTAADIRDYVAENVKFPVAVLQSTETIARYQVGKIPHAVVIDRAGSVTYVGNPDRDPKGFQKAVRKALKAKPPAADADEAR